EHLRVAAGLRDQPTGERLEARLDDVVIVAGLRVNRNRPALAPLQDRQRIAIRAMAVVEAEHDDGAYLRPERVRALEPRGGRFHPIHVAMGSFGKEMPQPLGRLRDRVRPRDADDVETGLARRAAE